MKYRPIILLASLGLTSYAHDPITTQVTWDREVFRLISSRCISCHREGGAAFSLATYEAARPWAKAIKEETLERRMPPFGAVKGFADLRDDPSLTQEQLELISDWVEGGAPEGDASLLPSVIPVPAKKEVPATRAGLLVKGSTVLREGLTVCAIEPKSLSGGASMRAIAQRPDGSIVPLIWVYQYNPKFPHVYYFRQPFVLAAGTRIIMSPGEVSLLSPAGPGGRH